MKKRFFFPISIKLILAFMFVFIVPAVGMLWLLSQRFETAFDKITQPRLKNALATVEADFSNKAQSAKLQTESLARNERITEAVRLSALSNFEKDITYLIYELEWLGKSAPLDFMYIANGDRILAAYPDKAGSGAPLPAADSEPVQSALRGSASLRITRAVNNRGTLAIMTYVPIIYDNGEQRAPAPEAVLVGGSFIKDDYLKNLNRLTDAQILFFAGDTLAGTYPPVNKPPVDAAFLRATDDDPGKTRIAHLDGGEYIFGAVPIKQPAGGEPAGHLALGVSREQLNAAREKSRSDMMFIALLGAGISIVLGIGVSLGISRPITALDRSARLIGKGRFMEAKNRVRTHDEIGRLGQAMNLMIDDIKAYNERLAMSERVAAWRDIARRIAHEIKNPLSPIQLSIENMKASFTQDPDEFKRMFPESADTVLEEVDKLRRLANEFSAFARMPKPAFERIDITEILENVVNLYAKSAPDVHASITSDAGRGLFVRADRDQLNRVFTNLVKNAIEAMPGGGELKILLRHVNDEIFVVIEDTGVGMDAEETAKIFTPYYTTKTGGSGLGLAIVQRIIQDHGASLDVYSEKGAGTKFIIAFRELDDASAQEGGGPVG